MRQKIKVSKSGQLYTSESDLQISCIRYFSIVHAQYSGLLFSIPNGARVGGKMNKSGKPIGAMILKAEGMTPGVCDLFLAIAKGGFNGLFIEMKTIEGVLSSEQKYFIRKVRAQNYAVIVCCSIDQFAELIEKYLNEELIEVKI